MKSSPRLRDRLTLSTVVIGAVGLTLAATMIPIMVWQISNERAVIENAAKNEAVAALDMLEAVHVNAMLFRDQKEDNDPAVDTLNGAMVQFSEQNMHVELWLVMSQKVLDYQIAQGQQEIEGPLDEIDQRALDEGTSQTVVTADGRLRMTRPVVMGRGTATDPKCAACHTAFMGINEGELIGAYSAKVDLSTFLASWRSFAERTVIGGLLVILANLLLIYFLLRRYILKPVIALSNVADSVARGKDDITFDGGRRNDALGVLARSLNLLKVQMRERMQLEVKAARAQEAEQAALATDRAKSEFLATMSHEIRTPLNGVMGMAELLSKTELDDKQNMFAETIVRSGESLLGIINDVLDYSKIEAGQMQIDAEPFNVIDAIEDTATLFSARAATKEIELFARIDPDIPPFLISDKCRFTQILSNLVGNAVKFTETGHVLINAKGQVCPHDPDRFELSVDVVDTGIGIAEDECKKVFDKFLQVDMSATRKHKGTGLGLAISAALVKMMGGEIKLASEIGQGSTFSVKFSLKIAPNACQNRRAFSEIHGARILVVDDHEINRMILREQLGQCGCEVETYSDGSKAITKLREAARDGVQFDLVILDFQMPGLSGTDVLRIIRADHELVDLAVIMLTSVDQNAKEQAEALGLQGHLLKPVRSALLYGQIELALASKAGRPEGPMQTTLRQRSVASASRKISGSNAGQGGPIDILLCEDNEINRNVAIEMLDELGLSYLTAADGQVGVNLFEQHFPRLVLMDISMPVMNGFQALAAIREIEGDDRNTPVIALTAQALAGDREKCLNAGFDDYVAKPFSLEELETAIETWLQNEVINWPSRAAS